MKTIINLLSIVLFGTISAQSCDSIPPQYQIGYSTGSHTFCVPGTYNLNQSMAQWVRITQQYTDTNTCTFSVNGGPPTVTTSITFTPSAAGITTFVLIGTNPAYPACTQTVTWTFTTVACQYTYTGPATGIEQYNQAPADQVRYYDLQGNPVEKQYNTLLIEQAGYHRRKVYFQ